MKNKIFSVVVIMFSIILLSQSQTVYANSFYMHSDIIDSLDIEDVIVLRHRIHNGKAQHRRWNKTKKMWVDTRWIDD